MVKLRESDSSDTITGDVLRENDNSPEVGDPPGRDPLDSRVGLHLGQGYYVVEARLARPSEASSSRTLTLTVKSEEKIYHPSGAHQADRTVGYSIGRMPAPPAIIPPPPDHISQMMPRVVKGAIATWNSVGRSTWPYPLFCTEPCDRNKDNYVIAIRAGSPTEFPTSIGCMKSPSPSAHNHVTTGTVVLELPAKAPKDGGDQLFY